MSKMHVEMRHLKILSDGSAFRIQNLEAEAKIFKTKEQKFEVRINQFIMTMRDLENRN